MRFPLNTNICSKHCRGAETPKTTCWKVERPQAGCWLKALYLHISSPYFAIVSPSGPRLFHSSTLPSVDYLYLGHRPAQGSWIMLNPRTPIHSFSVYPFDCQDCSCLGHGRTQGSGIPISLQVSSGSACQWIASTFGIFLGAQRERERDQGLPPAQANEVLGYDRWLSATSTWVLQKRYSRHFLSHHSFLRLFPRIGK